MPFCELWGCFVIDKTRKAKFLYNIIRFPLWRKTTIQLEYTETHKKRVRHRLMTHPRFLKAQSLNNPPSEIKDYLSDEPPTAECPFCQYRLRNRWCLQLPYHQGFLEENEEEMVLGKIRKIALIPKFIPILGITIPKNIVNFGIRRFFNVFIYLPPLSHGGGFFSSIWAVLN